MSTLATVDLEEGTLADFASTNSGTNYTVAAATAAAKNGTYGFQAVATESGSDTSNSASGRKSVTLGSTSIDFGVDFWVRFPSWTSAGYGTITSKSLVHLTVGSEKSLWLPISSTRTVRVATQNGAFSNVQVGTGSVSLAANTWYKFRIEIRSRVYGTPSANIKVSYSTDGSTYTTLVDEATVSSRVGRLGSAADWDFGIYHANQWEKAYYTVDIDDIVLWDTNPPSSSTLYTATLTASNATTPALGRVIAVIRTGTRTPLATKTSLVSVAKAASVGKSPLLQKLIASTKAASLGKAGTLVRLVGATRSASKSVTGTLQRVVSVVRAAASPVIATLAAIRGRFITLTATVGTSPALQRLISATHTASTTTTGLLQKLLALTRSASLSVGGFLTALSQAATTVLWSRLHGTQDAPVNATGSLFPSEPAVSGTSGRLHGESDTPTHNTPFPLT